MCSLAKPSWSTPLAVGRGKRRVRSPCGGVRGRSAGLAPGAVGADRKRDAAPRGGQDFPIGSRRRGPCLPSRAKKFWQSLAGAVTSGEPESEDAVEVGRVLQTLRVALVHLGGARGLALE